MRQAMLWSVLNSYKATYADEWAEATKREVESSFRVISDFFGNELLINKITTEDCERFMAHLDEKAMVRDTNMPLSLAVKKKHIARLRSLFKHAVEYKYFDKNPSEGLQFQSPANTASKGGVNGSYDIK
jgi:site-specific recombinase XerD